MAPHDASCRRRDSCRLCGSSDLAKVLALTPTPPANAFVTADKAHEPQATYPLDVWFCRACGHVQLLDIVDPGELFSNYVYVSGTSPVFVRHFERYAQSMVAGIGLRPGDLVVDIGSNDGTLLRFFQGSGMKVLGVDPAKQIAAQATAAGIPTWPTFFNAEVSSRIRAEMGAAKCITANNVFAHIDDLAGIVKAVRSLLASDGCFVFEVSYLADVVEKTLFDTIYHEHLSYHSVRPLVSFFARHGMELVGAERVDTHGGSLRGIAQIANGPRRFTSVQGLLDQEAQAGLDREATFVAFGQQIEKVRLELRDFLHSLKAQGKRIAGFGAPAKATTLMFHFGLGSDLIEFIVDDSPLKQGLFSPGLHIPVVGRQSIQERRPDLLLILAWNFAESIMRNHAEFRRQGGRFIVPLPGVTVH